LGMGPKVGLRVAGQPWAFGRNPVGIGKYAAFLQNAGGRAVGCPERCSGLVYGVPLGHGARVKCDRIRVFGLGWWVYCDLKVDRKELHESAKKVATLGSMPMKGRA